MVVQNVKVLHAVDFSQLFSHVRPILTPQKIYSCRPTVRAVEAAHAISKNINNNKHNNNNNNNNFKIKQIQPAKEIAQKVRKT